MDIGINEIAAELIPVDRQGPIVPDQMFSESKAMIGPPMPAARPTLKLSQVPLRFCTVIAFLAVLIGNGLRLFLSDIYGANTIYAGRAR